MRGGNRQYRHHLVTNMLANRMNCVIIGASMWPVNALNCYMYIDKNNCEVPT